MMNFPNNLTPRTQQAINLSVKQAIEMKHNYIGTEHLLLGLLKLQQGIAVTILTKMGVDFDAVYEEVLKQTEEGQHTTNSKEIPYTQRFKKVIAIAASEAKDMNHSYIGTEHILLGLIKEGDGIAAKILIDLDVDIDEVREEISAALDPNYKNKLEHAGGNVDEPETKKSNKNKTPALDAYGTDLTEKAKNNQLDPIIGRTKEIERAIQILCRRTKNNPILIGEAGVGKTAIAEGLAQEIVKGNVPIALLNKKIICLDMALMIAGTKYRGQFEERIKKIMGEIKQNKNIILFLDEIHTIIGAGSAEGTMDASNMFKPALSRGELQCIGATTLKEFRKYIEKDAALERRFQQVIVDPPTVSQTIEILKGVRTVYEEHHNVEFLDESISAAVELSDRYITNRHLPDKAIDLLDEAGSRTRIINTLKAPNTDDLEVELKQYIEKKINAITNQEFEKAAKFRDLERNQAEIIKNVIADWHSSSKTQKKIIIDEQIIIEVISNWTGIPLQKLDTKETNRLLHMEKHISEKVIGQEEAVSFVCKALRRSKAGLKDPKRPIGSFLFLGSTGVGKTHLTQTLADFMFGSRENLIQFDMSEYMEKASVSRLIGAPPGYIGYEEGGQLTEAVIRKPYSVVLFDEIEKAHPDVMHLLLQILEEGKLTDSLGRKVDFKNTIIILTSNVGAEFAKKQNTMGFGAVSSEEDSVSNAKIMEEAKRLFKPELMNRLEQCVVFRSLKKEEISKIVDIELSKVIERLKEKQLNLNLNEEARQFLIEKGYDSTYGARPMRRAIEKYIEDPLSEELLKNTFKEGDIINATIKSGTIEFTSKKLKRKK